MVGDGTGWYVQRARRRDVVVREGRTYAFTRMSLLGVDLVQREGQLGR